MTAPTHINFFADFQGLAALKNDAKAQAPTALKEAARQFESLFTQMLLKSMREANKSFGEDSLFGSDQADMYQDMFDDQIAMQMSKGKGLGLADMLVRQLQGGVGATSRGQEASATPKTQAPAPVASSKDDFLRTMRPHAEKAAREIGVDPDALLAQAALETGWGRSVPCNAQGECSFNLFGIKAGSQWSGATVNVPTLEFESGIPVRKVERFRAYDSPADSFRDYAALIRDSSRYASARGAGDNVEAFASALQQGGYATDPQYAQKIAAVADEVRARSDTLKFAAAMPSTTLTKEIF
ncbi:MAG TPA: flagellar assembly peptidoglycan hydrolase FlgJ [Steroidobacteraceae bacterium]|jgi:flagellar protein FlgJ|nr:flagellar assembly peptidoglycan hydrolase FlgJ [Steroidobacteraceae bacterium]